MPDPEPVPEMVERVARVMCRQGGHAPDEVIQHGCSWSGEVRQCPRWHVWVDDACELLNALRPMSKAMSRAAVRGRDGHHVIGDPDVVWSCILDAMLQPEPELLHVSEEESRRFARLVLRDKVDAGAVPEPEPAHLTDMHARIPEPRRKSWRLRKVKGESDAS